MIAVGTELSVADNSGAKKLKVIGIPTSQRGKVAYLGDVVVAAVSGASSTGTVKDHSVVKVVVVRTRKEKRRQDGSYIRFSENGGVVIDADGNMIGTRVFGPVGRELRDNGYLKLVSLAPEVW